MKPQKYKVRFFFKDIITEKGTYGKIEICNISKETLIQALRDRLDKTRKIIIEVK